MVNLQFTAANGIPAGAYAHLIEAIQQTGCRIDNYHAIELIGHGKHRASFSWSPLAEELIEHIEFHGYRPVVGVGHSMGAVVTLMAAAKRPELFSRLILFEPAITGRVWRLLGIAYKIPGFPSSPAARRARSRQAEFSTRHEALNYFQGKRFFKNFHPRSLQNYVDSGLVPRGKGLALAFSKEIEANLFDASPVWAPRPRSPLDVTICFGESSELLPLIDFYWWRKRWGNVTEVRTPGGHMFPLEYPTQTAALTAQILLGRAGGAHERNRAAGAPVRVERLDGAFHLRYSLQIDAEPAAVFAWIGHPAKHGAWNSTAGHIERLQVTANKAGTTWRQAFSVLGNVQRSHCEIVEYIANERICISYESAMFSMTVQYDLEVLGSTAKLMVTTRTSYKSVAMKLISTVAKDSMRRATEVAVAGSLRALKTVCEGKPPPATAEGI